MTADGGTYEAGTWVNSPVSVSLSGSTDNLTLSPEYQYKIDDGQWISGSGYEITASGIYTIYSRSVDNAGNYSAVDTKTVKIDTVLPSDAVISTTPDYSFGAWSNQDIAVSFGGSSDNLTDPEDIEYSYSFDGNAYTTGDKLVLDEDGIYDVYFKACDESGLCSVVSRNFKIDKTSPTVPGTAMTTDGETYEAGTWTNSPVSVSLSDSSDNISGVQKYQYKIDNGEWTDGTGYEISASGIYTIYCRTVDNAGNYSDIDIMTVKVDLDQPQLFEINTSCDVIGSIDIEAAASDSLSGIAESGYRIFDGREWSEWKNSVDETLSGYSRGEVVTIKVEAMDNSGNVRSVTKEVTTLLNTDPVAEDDGIIMPEDTGRTEIDVLANDHDADMETPLGDTLRVVSVSELSDIYAGKVSFDDNGISFTPRPDYNGKVTLTYVIADELDAEASASLTITVTAVNDKPVVHDEFITTYEEQSISVDVLANDSDVDSDLFIKSYNNPSNGSVRRSGSGFVYTPDKDFYGSDRFTYFISDGQYTVAGNVIINVINVNDSPVLNADSVSTLMGQSVTADVLANDSDVEDMYLEISSVTQPQHGTAYISGNKVVYIPDEGYTGSDQLSYAVNDHGIVVSAVLGISIEYPDFYDEHKTVIYNAGTTPNEGEGDDDGDSDDNEGSGPVITQQPRSGEVKILGDDIYYTPDTEGAGIDTFFIESDSTVYQVVVESDENGNTEIIGYGKPLGSDDFEVEMSSEFTLDISGIIGDNGIDNIEITANPENGKVVVEGNSLVYIPNEDFVGEDLTVINVMVNGELTPFVAMFNVVDNHKSLTGFYISLLILILIYIMNYFRFRQYYNGEKARPYVYFAAGALAVAITYTLLGFIGWILPALFLSLFDLANIINGYLKTREQLQG